MRTVPKAEPYEPKPPKLPAAFAIVIVCAALQAAAVATLYLPNHFPSGGFTGIATIVNHFTGWPIWLILIAMDIPGFAIAFRILDVRFVLLSLAGTLTFSAAFALLEGFALPVTNPFLASAFGGVAIGVTGAFAVSAGGSMGGLDIVTLILNKKFGLRISTFALLINSLVLAALVFLSGLEPALLTMAGIYASSLGFNAIMDGFNRTKTVLIISSQWSLIAAAIMEQIGRGATYLHAEGAYTGEPRRVVYCVLRTTELVRVKDIVRGIDPHAIFSVIDTREVTGRGFSAL